MKIHNITIENIASLAGVHYLDFNSIFQTSQIFAITGETGSGKSTILNSISLCLYGQNYKRNIGQLDFVTLGKSHGKIELEFTELNKRYLAHWSCKVLKNNGEKLKAPKITRWIKDINTNETLEKSPQDYLMLNFEQFCRTTILNQGEFSKFLSSSFTERKEILEQLYNNPSISLISTTTKKQLSKITQEKELQLERIGILTNSENKEIPLSAEDFSSLKKRKAHNENILNGLEKCEKLIIEIEKSINQKNKNIERRDHNSSQISKLSKEVNQLKTQIIKKSDQITEVKKDFTKIRPKLEEAKTLLAIIKELSIKIRDLARDLEKHNLILESIQNELSDNITNINELSNKLNSLTYDLALKNLTIAELEETKSLSFEIKTLYSSRDILNATLKEKGSRFEQIKESGKTISDSITENEKSEKSINSKLNTFNIEILRESITKLNALKVQISEKNHQIEKVQLSLNKTDSNTQLLKEEIALLNNQLDMSKTKKELLTSQIENQKLTIAIELCHKHSVKEGHCIVCNNELTNSKDFSIIEKQDNSLDEDLRKILENENELSVNIKSKIKQVEFLNKKTIDEQVLITEYQSQISSQLKKSGLENPKEIDSNIFEYTSKIDNYTHREKSLLEIKTQTQSLIQQRQKLRDDYSKVEADIKEINNQLNSLDKLLSDKKAKSSIFTNIPSIADVTNNIENAIRAHQYAELVKEKNLFIRKLTNDKQTTEKTINELKSKIADAKRQESEAQQKQLKLNIKSDPYDIFIKFEKEIEEKQKDLEFLKTKKQSLDVTMANLQSQFSMSNEQILQIETLLFKDSNDLNDTCSNLVELLIEPRSFYKSLSKKIEIQEVSIDIINESIKEIKQHINTYKSNRDEAIQLISKNELLVAQIDKSQKAAKILKKELKAIDQQISNLENLHHLVGRDEFRGFILAMIEKDLIIHTNQQLENLCQGRYRLEHITKNAKIAPDFYVIDKFNAGLTRKVSTLSGGESFMISLAMALGLADMSKGASQIDSFFIDEGFGTLDDDSLEDVLNMLESMNQLGKQVGIISHIKSLTSRIPINILLKKKMHGHSEIKIQYN